MEFGLEAARAGRFAPGFTDCMELRTIQNMEHRISATELARRLGDALGRVRYRGTLSSSSATALRWPVSSRYPEGLPPPSAKPSLPGAPQIYPREARGARSRHQRARRCRALSRQLGRHGCGHPRRDDRTPGHRVRRAPGGGPSGGEPTRSGAALHLNFGVLVGPRDEAHFREVPGLRVELLTVG